MPNSKKENIDDSNPKKLTLNEMYPLEITLPNGLCGCVVFKAEDDTLAVQFIFDEDASAETVLAWANAIAYNHKMDHTTLHSAPKFLQ